MMKSPNFIWTQKFQNSATVILCVLLIGYISFMLINTYMSQTRLYKTRLAGLKNDVEKRATAASYFFSERKNDLRNLSHSREVSAFFENRALGMSMQYGLRSSLISIYNKFRQIVEEKTIRGDKIYYRLLFIESNGELLIDSLSNNISNEQSKNWAHLLTPESTDAVIIAEGSKMAVSIPFFLKSKYSGQIFAWIAPQSIYDHLIREETSRNQFVGIASGVDNIYFPEEMRTDVLYNGLSDIRKVEVGDHKLFSVTDTHGKSVDMIAMRVEVKDTPFSIISVIPSSEVFGRISPWQLLMAMAALSIVVLAGTFIVWRANTQKLVFRTRLDEASKRENEVKQKNLELLEEISDREQAEEALRETERKLARSQKMEALGLLAGGVAHDLNNVLSGIVSYPELLLMDIPEESPLRKPILTIKESGQRAADIVKDLLTLARRGVMNTEVLNLNDMVSEYLKSPEHIKIKSYHSNVHIETNLDRGLLNIKGSPIHIEKTIMNLVSNAAEAQPDGGKVLVSTKNKYVDTPVKGYEDIEEGDFVVLRVEDNGTGIAPDDIERIFEPFYTKKVMGRSGTGLGMAVVWGTIQDHKGYINVESTEGKGTIFEIYFPVTRKEIAKETSSIPTKDYMGNGETVLVVDDIREQREIASSVLNKLGYSVTTVSSGEEAIEYMKGNSIDLIVLDMIMEPGMNGYETYKEIIKTHPNQKAIIASGFSETDDVKKAQKLGVGKYIKKPYTFEKIGLTVKEELEK